MGLPRLVGGALRSAAGEVGLRRLPLPTDDEDTFLTAAAHIPQAPFFSSNLEVIASRGVLGTSWRLPLPNPPDRLALTSLTQFPKCPAKP